MYNPNDEGPISPMKKLKILSEKQQNVQIPKELALETIKEAQIAPQPQPVAEEVKKQAEPSNEEPLMQESTGQYVIFPINNQDMWKMYKHFVDTFWTPVDNLEAIDKLNLNNDERQFMKFFASFFASPDSKGLVIDTYAEDFCKVIQVTEARFFYGHQLFVQDLHYEMYNMILDKVASANEEKEKLFKIVEGIDAIVNKRNWIKQWSSADFGMKMTASACIHGIFFLSLDLVLNWLKNKFRGSFTHELIEVIEKMIADQELCRDFACLMLSHIKAKPAREAIIEMINSSVKIEFDFILNGLKMAELIQLESDDLIQVIDRRTKDLKSKIFGSLEEKKNSQAKFSTINAHESDLENAPVSAQIQKENHQKIVFDEDF